MDNLSGRIALVTGANRGIGREIAIALSPLRAPDVVVNYRSHESEAEETRARIREHNRRCLSVRADVSIMAEVARLIETVESKMGVVSILVNNAGVTRPQQLDEITEGDWDEVIRVNLKSVFLVTKALLPGMREHRWGRIINLSSIAAQTGGVVGPHYAASESWDYWPNPFICLAAGERGGHDQCHRSCAH